MVKCNEEFLMEKRFKGKHHEGCEHKVSFNESQGTSIIVAYIGCVLVNKARGLFIEKHVFKKS